MTTTQDPTYGGYVAPPNLKRGLAISALVLGIVAIVGRLIPILNIFSMLLALVGLVLGLIALSKIKKGLADGRGLALTGIILSAVAILGAIASNVLFGAAVNSMSDTPSSSSTAPLSTPSDPAVESPSVSPSDTTSVQADSATVSQTNAVKSANQYLEYTAFSQSGLIKQLEFDGYSTDDATYAVNNVQVDYNEQAAKAAKNYLDSQSFSHSGLVKQLEFEGYTNDQAEYGVTQAGL